MIMFKQLILCISVNPIINMKNNKNKKEKAIESSVRVLIRVRPLISIEQSTKNIISISSDVFWLSLLGKVSLG